MQPGSERLEQRVDEIRRGGRLFGGVIRQGFHLALLYAATGLVLELLHQVLPGPVYQRLGGAVYGLPMKLLVSLGLESRLVAAVAHGQVPAWVAGAAVPSLGVATILLLSVILGAFAGFAGLVASLKQH